MAEPTPEEKAAAEKATADKKTADDQVKAEKAAAEKAEKALATYIEEEKKSLTRMFKDGTELFVHPTCVKAHQDAGWAVAA